MQINEYARQLSKAEIDAKEHRELVGGLWEEIGALQFEYLKKRGLLPSHRLLDLGCGALRGGLHFIRYLDTGNYYGMDVNASLIEAGRRELDEAKLADRQPHLLVADGFELGPFATTFDYAIAVSVFSHLPMNHIIQCLARTRQVLRPGAHLLASYFEAPDPDAETVRAVAAEVRQYAVALDTMGPPVSVNCFALHRAEMAAGTAEKVDTKMGSAPVGENFATKPTASAVW